MQEELLCGTHKLNNLMDHQPSYEGAFEIAL